MHNLLVGLNLTLGQRPNPMKSIQDKLKGFLEPPPLEVLEGLSMPTTLGTNLKSLELIKPIESDFDARSRLERVVEITTQIPQAALVPISVQPLEPMGEGWKFQGIYF